MNTGESARKHIGAAVAFPEGNRQNLLTVPGQKRSGGSHLRMVRLNTAVHNIHREQHEKEQEKRS